MHKSKLKQISLAVCLAFMPIYGLAAGLGKLNVNSGLGEPLRAEIELLSLTADELASLSASVAPEEAYAVQGIPRLGIHNNIKVELAKSADGSPILRLNSLQPVSDPYLDMLIQVDWSSGRLLREYTILLDPPEYKQTIKQATTASSAIINKPTVIVTRSTSSAPSQNNASASSVNQQTADNPKKSKPASTKANDAEINPPLDNDAQSSQVTTQRGDSLAMIAKEVKPDGVSLNQMLVGLYEANKEAFIDNNMNRLKVGQILKVPSKNDLTAVGTSQANKEVKLHSANWNAYRNSLAGNVLAAEVTEQNEVKQSASGKISTAEDRAALTKTGPQDVVKLSAGGKDAKAGNGADAKVLALQEETIAKEKALLEAQQRTAALEAQIADMQKLLALKNQAMANAQQSAELQAAATTNAKPEAVKPDTAKLVEVKPPEVKAVEAAPVADAQPVANTPPPVTPSPPAANSTSKPKAAPPVLAATPEAELSFFDSIFAAVDFIVLAALAGIALLAAGWAYLRNKRKRDLDSFERGILTSGGLSANTVFGNTTGSASTSDTSFLTDFAQSADGGMIDTNDVDPIAEAEVYMAYGRDAQAEEILKDAIVKEPKRYELHLKLLEMYAARKDISAFEAIAGELYTTLGSDNPTWAKVAELGSTVEPDNPLYDLSRLPVASAEAVSMGVAAATVGEAIEKELDWEKELDLDKELEFSTGFAEVTNDSVNADAVVVNADSNMTEELASEQINSTLQDQLNDAKVNDTLNDEMALFGANLAPSEPLTTSPEFNSALEEEKADNSLNFDFSEMGNFALDNPAIDAPAQPAVDENMEFSSALAFPEAIDDNESITSFADETLALPEVAAKTEPQDLDFNFAVTPADMPSLNEPKADSSLDFNFVGLNQEAEPVTFEPAPAPASTFDNLDFDLDISQQSTSEFEQDKFETAALQGMDLSFNETGVEANQQAEEIKFDLPSIDDDADSVPSYLQPSEPAVASNFDFSSISLDLTDSTPSDFVQENTEASQIDNSPSEMIVPEQTLEQQVIPDVVDVMENPDVDIKLDLVKVYIDMDDVEGARDLLDEVIKEGGPNQRQTAEKLLSNLA